MRIISSPFGTSVGEACAVEDSKHRRLDGWSGAWSTYLDRRLTNQTDLSSAMHLLPHQSKAIGAFAAHLEAIATAPQETASTDYCWRITDSEVSIYELAPEELALARKFTDFAHSSEQAQTKGPLKIGEYLLRFAAMAHVDSPAQTIGYVDQMKQYLEGVVRKTEQPRFVVPSITESIPSEWAVRYKIITSDTDRVVALNPATITQELLKESSVAVQDSASRSAFEELLRCVCKSYAMMTESMPAEGSESDADLTAEYSAARLHFQLTLIRLELFRRQVIAQSVQN